MWMLRWSSLYFLPNPITPVQHNSTIPHPRPFQKMNSYPFSKPQQLLTGDHLCLKMTVFLLYQIQTTFCFHSFLTNILNHCNMQHLFLNQLIRTMFCFGSSQQVQNWFTKNVDLQTKAVKVRTLLLRRRRVGSEPALAWF